MLGASVQEPKVPEGSQLVRMTVSGGARLTRALAPAEGASGPLITTTVAFTSPVVGLCTAARPERKKVVRVASKASFILELLTVGGMLRFVVVKEDRGV